MTGPAISAIAWTGCARQTVGDRTGSTSWWSTAPRRATLPAQLEQLVAAGSDNARLLRVEQPGVSVARNAGAQEAAGDYIAYIDDDAIPARDWIERIAAGDQRDRPAAGTDRRTHPAALGSAVADSGGRRSLRGSLSIIELRRAGRIPHRRAAARAGTVRREHGRARPIAARDRRLRHAKRPHRRSLAVGRGGAARLAPAGRRAFGALRLADRRAASDPGGTADARPGCCRGSTGRASRRC